MARIYRKGMKRLPKKPPMEEDTSNLPCDVIQNILARLPVKSLFRFKSVSKSWNSIISDTEFSKIHLHQSKNSESQTLFLLDPSFTSSRFCLLKFTNPNFQTEAVLEFPLKKYRHAYVLCSCDGLVLLKNYSRTDKMYVLWNPFSRIYRKFSCPYPVDHFLTNYGLCYDQSNDDYKVVFVTTKFYAVFSYKNNSWRKELSILYIRRDPGLVVNGAIHWVVSLMSARFLEGNLKAQEDLSSELSRRQCTNCYAFHILNCPIYECNFGFTHEIYCFDPRDDEFKKVPKPERLEEIDAFSLTSLGDHLCLYRNTYDMTMVEIWMMKEYGDGNSWMKFLTIENVPVLSHCSHCVKPLFLTNKSEVVLDINYSDFVVYSHTKKKFGETQVYYAERHRSYWDMRMSCSPLMCLESLFLPTRINRRKRK